MKSRRGDDVSNAAIRLNLRLKAAMNERVGYWSWGSNRHAHARPRPSGARGAEGGDARIIHGDDLGEINHDARRHRSHAQQQPGGSAKLVEAPEIRRQETKSRWASRVDPASAQEDSDDAPHERGACHDLEDPCEQHANSRRAQQEAIQQEMRAKNEMPSCAPPG
jgi:hypothetical protein